MKTHEKYMAIHTELVEEALGKPYGLEETPGYVPETYRMSREGLELTVSRNGTEYLHIDSLRAENPEEEKTFCQALAAAIAARPEMAVEHPGENELLAAEWRTGTGIQQEHVLQAAGDGATCEPHPKLGYRFWLVSGEDFDVSVFDQGNGWMDISRVVPKGTAGAREFEDRLRKTVHKDHCAVR